MNQPESAAKLASWDAFIERLYRQNEFAIKLGLDSIDWALELEGRPEKTHRIILVGGTNGKGETASFLSSILTAHGFCVGLFTSPHILDFRERFRVDGELMSRDEVLEQGRYVLERYGEPKGAGPQLTFFELATLMAVRGFAERGVDVGVYEVGLGGRLDATNALCAELSVVTSVALDHTQYLGETFEEVAAEKAGIFRPERPAVIGRQAHKEAESTLRELAPQRASLYGDDFRAEEDGTLHLSQSEAPIDWMDGLPPTRRWNGACAAEAACRFLGCDFDQGKLQAGLEANRWPGRLDLQAIPHDDRSHRRHYLFDAAHNPDGAEALFEFVAQRGLKIGAVVCSAMKDKDLEGIFSVLPDDVPVFAAVLDSPRGASSEQLEQVLQHKTLVEAGPAAQMLAGAQERVEQGAGELILVFGSVYLLGECFASLGIEADSLVTYR